MPRPVYCIMSPISSDHLSPHPSPSLFTTMLSPHRSPTVRRKGSVRKRAGSHVPPTTKETHDAALHQIRNFLKGHSTYDAFPVSFRLIVLDTKLNVKKALQCLLLNGKSRFLLRIVRSTSSSSRVTRSCFRSIVEQ